MLRLLDDVLARPDVWRGNQFVGGFARANRLSVASGFAALDAELPGGGWPRGAVDRDPAGWFGLGRGSLLLPALLQIQQEGEMGHAGRSPHRAHGPAWVCAGVNPAEV
ncbi:MAG: hypothetical protein IPI89_12020 [Propionivibrio sp.]|nr:hypothetical protein [Propionivibrio sp.]